MRKEIALLLVVAVLLLGGAAAIFESVNINSWKIPVFDPKGPGGGIPATPDGDPLPDGPA